MHCNYPTCTYASVLSTCISMYMYMSSLHAHIKVQVWKRTMMLLSTVTSPQTNITLVEKSSVLRGGKTHYRSVDERRGHTPRQTNTIGHWGSDSRGQSDHDHQTPTELSSFLFLFNRLFSKPPHIQEITLTRASH